MVVRNAWRAKRPKSKNDTTSVTNNHFWEAITLLVLKREVPKLHHMVTPTCWFHKIESELPYLSLVLWYRPMKIAETHVLPFCCVKRYEQPLLKRYNSLSIKNRSPRIAPYSKPNMLNSKIESELLYFWFCDIDPWKWRRCTFCRVERYEQPLLRSHNSFSIKDRNTKIAPYGNTHMLISKIKSELPYLILVLWYRRMKKATMRKTL